MQPEVFTRQDSRTLLVDAGMEQGGQLVEQLNHAGFKTDFAVSWGAAHAALSAYYYHSCIVVADVDQLTDAVPGTDFSQSAEVCRLAPAASGPRHR
jgi:hypothetical protein